MGADSGSRCRGCGDTEHRECLEEGAPGASQVWGMDESQVTLLFPS